MTNHDATNEEYLSPRRIHTRLQILEAVTLVSLILNLALWYYVGKVNTKVENEVATNPPTVQTQR